MWQAPRLPVPPSPEKDPLEDPNHVLCACRHVTVGRILSVMDQGHRRLFQVQRETGAGLGCGSCKEELVRLIIKKNNPGAGGKP